MILNSLSLQNFKRYKEAEFNFNLGLTGLLGRNGSGKSTIFEAIIFALYGESKTKKELIRNSSANSKDAVVVKLQFNIDGKEYLIERELRGKSLTAKANLFDSSKELIATSVKEVNKEIVKLIGMSKEAFVNTIYASQKELTALSNLKNDDRKKIIRKLIGLEKIDRIEKELVDKIRELKRDIASFKELLLPKEQLDNILKQKEHTLKQIDLLKADISNLTIKLEEKEKEVTKSLQNLEKEQKLKEDYNKLLSTLELIKAKFTNITKSLQELLSKKSQLELDSSYYNKNISILESYKELEKQIAYYQKQKELIIKKEGLLKEQESLREQVKTIRQDIKNLQLEIDKKSQIDLSKKSKEQELVNLKNSLEDIEKQERNILNQIAQNQAIINTTKSQLNKIEKIGKGSNCPTCTRPLLEEYESVVNSLNQTINLITNNQLKNLEASLKEVNKSKDSLKVKIDILEKEINSLNTRIELILSYQKEQKNKKMQLDSVMTKGLQNKDALAKLEGIEYNETEHKNLVTKRQKLEPQYKKLLGLQKVIEELPKVQEQIQKLQKELKELKTSQKAKEEEIKKHSFKSENEELAKKEYQNSLKAKDTIATQLKAKEIELTKQNGILNTINAKLEQNALQTEKLKEKEQNRDDYEKLRLFLKDFKTKINSQVAPRISQLASDMFYEVTKGKYQLIEVDNEFNFFIYDEGKKYPIERFSGGEIDLANLVLRIAISKTLNELSSNTNIGFLAFDEVFGSQDEDRRYAIMESFNKISENYRQIFLISHDKEIKELFENVIEL